jgi:hypothetical protein
MVYGRIIPLSIGAGITFIEGIADYDIANRFGLPQSDDQVPVKDAEWHNRPDYEGNLWVPDGVERDRYRFTRGVEAVRSDPTWFLGVMVRRAGFMLRYNDNGESRWPFGTALVPVVSAEPPFGHIYSTTHDLKPDWSITPEEMMKGAENVSEGSDFGLSVETGGLLIYGDASEYGDQFMSAPIAVEPHTDYIVSIPVQLLQGKMAIKVTSSDRRIAIASLSIPQPKKANKKAARDKQDSIIVDESGVESLLPIRLTFASGDRTEVRLVLSNDGTSSETLTWLDQVEIFKLGSTPYQWTSYPRPIIRAIQKNFYRTGTMLTLISVGIALLAFARRWQALMILMAVPLYYLCFQSILHTEYRYILAIHYFLFIMTAVTIYCGGAAVKEITMWLKSRMTGFRSID